MRLFNEMGQHIIHKGQLCLGDTVKTGPLRTNYYIVVKLKGTEGRVESCREYSRYPIQFIKGRGWVW